jgi:tetratricopeptide (TPR) repeat protein
VEDGQLFEVQTALVSEQAEPDLADPELITRINMVYDRFPVTSDFYHDDEMQTLLEAYRQQIPDSMLLFPQITLQCIRGLQKLSNQRMMLLTADKGHHRIEELLSVDEVPIAIHDNGFSTLFNFHAIVKYFEQKGGTVLTTQHRHKSINILACLLGEVEFPETRHAYYDYIERISPDDLYNVLLEFQSQKDITLQNILSYIRLKQYDSHAFIAVSKMLISMLPEQYTEANARNLQIMLHEVWNNYYHMDEPYNLPMAIATILQKIHDFRNALGFYMYTVQLYGPNSMILMNMVICHMQLGNRQAALELVTQLEVELPEDGDVKHLKSQVEAMKE